MKAHQYFYRNILVMIVGLLLVSIVGCNWESQDPSGNSIKFGRADWTAEAELKADSCDWTSLSDVWDAWQPSHLPPSFAYDPDAEWRIWQTAYACASSNDDSSVYEYDPMPWRWDLPFRGCWYLECGYGWWNGRSEEEFYSTEWTAPDDSDGWDIVAPAAGWCLYAGWKRGWGNVVIIEAGPAGETDDTRYLNVLGSFESISVQPGSWIEKGGVLGKWWGGTNTLTAKLRWTLYRGEYVGKSAIAGDSWPPSWESGIDGFTGNNDWWCSEKSGHIDN